MGFYDELKVTPGRGDLHRERAQTLRRWIGDVLRRIGIRTWRLEPVDPREIAGGQHILDSTFVRADDGSIACCVLIGMGVDQPALPAQVAALWPDQLTMRVNFEGALIDASSEDHEQIDAKVQAALLNLKKKL